MLLWFDDFLAQVQREGGSPETVKKLRRQHNALVNVYGLDLKRCSERELLDVLDKLSKKKRTYYYQLCIFIRRLLMVLGRKKLHGLVVLPKREQPQDRIKDMILTPDEVKRLIDGASDLSGSFTCRVVL